jgi:hypothetical protein
MFRSGSSSRPTSSELIAFAVMQVRRDRTDTSVRIGPPRGEEGSVSQTSMLSRIFQECGAFTLNGKLPVPDE